MRAASIAFRKPTPGPLPIAVLMLAFFLCGTPQALAEKPLGQLLSEAIQDYQFQEFDRARQGLLHVLEVEPENAYALHYLGRIELETGHPDKAIEYLKKQIHGKLRFQGDEELLANAYLKAGRAVEAERLAARLLKSAPNTPSVIFIHARALEASKQYSEALDEYERLYDVPGFGDPAHFQAGVINYRFGAYRLAAREFESIHAEGTYGKTARQYLDALEPAIKPLNLSISYQYFYNDNPGAASATHVKGAIPSVQTASHGDSISASLSTARFDISRLLHFQLMYAFSANYYRNRDAKANDYEAHYIQGTGTWSITPNWKLDGVASFQTIKLDRMHLNNVYTGKVTLTYTPDSQKWSAYLNAGVAFKRNSSSYGRGLQTTDLTYLDSDSPSGGFGGSYFFSTGGFIQGNYLFQLERTLNNINAVLDQKSRDSYYRQHNVSLAIHLPMPKQLSRATLDLSGNYFYRSYLYQQSGITLPSIKPGNYLRAIGKSGDVTLSVLLWKRTGLTLAAGYHWEQTKSDARELSYVQNKYYGQISAQF